MDTVRNILRSKGGGVYAVAPDARLLDALGIMAEHDIGAVVVVDGSIPVGILTEREYARHVELAGRSSRTVTVAEVMNPYVPCVSPGDSVQHCMEMMVDQHVRHLVVVERGEIIGLVSLGDIVRALLGERDQAVSVLHEYIWGLR